MSNFIQNPRLGNLGGKQTRGSILGDVNNKRPGKVDNSAQVFFIGQIAGGVQFENSDGVFCEMILDVGPQWTLMNGGQQRNESDANDFKSIQTQTAYASPGTMLPWNHPIDLEFKLTSLNGWPKGILKVWSLDDNNKIDILSYGVVNFPRKEGYHRLEVQTWSPMGDQKATNSSFFLGTRPRLSNLDILQQNEKRSELLGLSNGTVVLEIEVMMRHIKEIDLTQQDNKLF